MKPTTENVTIKAPNIVKARFKIQGTAPYVQLRFSEKAINTMIEKHKLGSQANKKKAKEALIEAGINKDVLYSTEFISPAAAEKLLDKEQKVILEELTVKESSGVTIARDASLRQ